MTTAVVGLSLSPTWWRGGAWREIGSRIEDLASGEALVDAARLADSAGVQFAFKPDSLELDASVLTEWPGQTGPDPLVLMSAIARETRRIGLVPTYSTTFAEPYLVARELQTLDQLSAGRAGWNAVTSLGGSRNMSGEQPSADERYGRAREVIETVRRLHASYPARAVLADREGAYADASLIAEIERTERFDVRGPLTVPAVRDEPLPLLHAGGSPASLTLAARHADAVFAMTESASAGEELRRGLAALAGERATPRVLPGVVLCLGATRDRAWERFEAAGGGGGARHWTIVGTPADASQQILGRIRAGAADGIIALPYGSWEAVELFTGEVMPELLRSEVFAPPRPDLREILRRR
ncbi:MAG: LLM class flavin-dependent oxidoreductase [Microbacterium gubbeenense]|uniref:LLM class flavin-dependent oxidoreductase n=1 Tax=Microbacterium gubbeenense TaxID=159896 RepID=UPI003F9BC36A